MDEIQEKFDFIVGNPPYIRYEKIPANVRAVYKKMFASNEMIEDIITFKNADIVKIGGMLRESGYEIRSWVCGTDRYESPHSSWLLPV